jgi:hypothetical protein
LMLPFGCFLNKIVVVLLFFLKLIFFCICWPLKLDVFYCIWDHARNMFDDLSLQLDLIGYFSSS